MGWEGNSVFQVLIVTGSTGSGLFAYSPRPGAGNLVASIVAAPGTDPFGNAYIAGVTGYIQAPTFAAAQLFGGVVQISTAPGSAGPWTSRGFISADTANNLNLFAQGGQVRTTANVFNAMQGLIVALGATITGGLTADTEVISSGVAGGNVLDVTNTTAGGAAPITRVTSAAAGDVLWAGRVSGDTNSRILLDTTGTGLARLRFGPGNAVADTVLERLAANTLGVLTADLAVDTAGRGLQVKEGTNAKQGTAVLNGAGTVVVATTAVTASSRIFLTMQDNAQVGTAGFLRVSARTAGTSFTVTSSSGTDGGTFAWEIFEPAP